jgi:hypothetical protein
VEPGRRADDVTERIERANFVEVDALQRNSVHSRFSLGQSAKDSVGRRSDGFLDLFEQPLDLWKVPDGWCVVGVDLDFGCSDATPLATSLDLSRMRC